MSNAAYYREYRARRKAEGNAVPHKPQKKHRTESHSLKANKWKRGRFIAWDGEGVTLPDGKHVYILLANSEGHYIRNPKGLSTRDCLEFLVREYLHPANKGAIHVWFSSDYDVNMMLGDISKEELAGIYADGMKATRLHGTPYSFHFISRHSFRVELHGEQKQTATFWDTWGFFQGSFVKAMKDYLGESYPDYQMIAENKQKRSTFVADDIEEIQTYCEAELKALAAMMRILHDAIEGAGLPPLRRYDGAGAIGTVILSSEQVKQHKGEPPESVKFAARCAYFGGRNEICFVGNYPNTVHHYDINSAYPAAMRHLPCLAHATWRHYSGQPPVGQFSMAHVIWCFARSDLPWYPLPVRDTYGQVTFPSSGEGWYWTPELRAADAWVLQHGEHRNLKYIERWECDSWCDCPPPFAFIDEYYQKRLELKEQGNYAQFAIKLGLNSLYGKLAQQVGRPTYHQLEWAGWITSVCRSELVRAGLQSPASILQFATDGIFSQKPLELPSGKALGQWEASVHQGIIMAQSGVYWLQNGEEIQGFKRGFGVNKIDHESVLRAWRQGLDHITTTSSRFVTGKSALAGLYPLSQWRTWQTPDRTLSITATGKRYYAPSESNPWKPAEALVRTYAEQNYGAPSQPYPLRSRMDEGDDDLDD